MLCTLQATGRTQTLDDSSAGIFPTFFPRFRRIASRYLKLPGMIHSAIWQIVKDGRNTASDSLLFTTM